MRVHGGIQILLGLSLLGLAVHAYGVAKVKVAVSLQNVSLSNLNVLYSEISGNPILAVTIGGPLLVTVVSLIAGLTHAVAGIGRFTQLDASDEKVSSFEDSNEVVDAVLRAQSPSKHQDGRGPLFQFIRSNFTERVDVVPRSLRGLVHDYLGYLTVVVIILGGLIVLRGSEISFGHFEHVGKLYFALPFAGLLMLFLIIVAGLRFAFAALLLTGRPESNILMDRQEFSAAGHPRTALEELRGAISQLDRGDRLVFEKEMELRQDPVTDVGQAQGSLILETPPRISEDQSKVSHWLGYAHSGIGAAMVFGGMFFMLKLAEVEAAARSFNIAPPILIIIVGLLAFSNGGQFFENAVRILRRRVYRSTIYGLELKGTVYRSEVGAGMADQDSFRSSSVAVRCELFVDYALAHCLSESDGGRGRRLLSLSLGQDLRQKLEALKRALTESQEKGASVLGMSLRSSPEVKEIAEANSVVFKTREAVTAAAQIQANQSGGGMINGRAQSPFTPTDPQSADPRTPLETAQGPVMSPFDEVEEPPSSQSLPNVSTASPEETVSIEVMDEAAPPGWSSPSADASPNGMPSDEAVVLPSGDIPEANRLPAPDPNQLPAPARPEFPKMPPKPADVPFVSMPGEPRGSEVPALNPSDLGAGDTSDKTSPEMPKQWGAPNVEAKQETNEIPASIANRPRISKTPPTAQFAPPSPISGLPAHLRSSAAISPKEAVSIVSSNDSRVSDTKDCPECAEVVKQAAIKCRFCGYYFDQ